MTNEELIAALRYCAEHEGCDHYIAKDCPREDTWVCGADCEQILMHDAADALEAAEKRIAELMPKEGEWIEVHDWLQIPQEECGTYRCSACGQVMKYPWNYCPNCGAKMRGEEQC